MTRPTDWTPAEQASSLQCIVTLAGAGDRGATAKELSQRVALSLARTQALLTRAGKRGLLARVRDGMRCRWVPPAKAAAARLAIEQARLVQQDIEDDGRPVRRCVPAGAPLPFVCSAPRSVFELGAML